LGFLCGSPTPAGRKLATLRQCAPFSPVLAALLGHTTRPGETTEERMDILDDKKAENVTEYTILLHGRFTGSVFIAAGGSRAIRYCGKADVIIFVLFVANRPKADKEGL